jgi:hypothetical protein
MRQQVKPLLVVRAMAAPAGGHDTERIATSAERAGDQVGCVDPLVRSADDTGSSGDGGTLASVAASDVVRWSGVMRRRGLAARNGARRRSGVRFIGISACACLAAPR